MIEEDKLFQVAAYLYSLNKDNIFTTKKFIQRITFYAYSYYLVKYNDNPDNLTNTLFENHKPLAYKDGPVFIELYKYMNIGRTRISC